jgi:K+-sensing histidine kinase KdpD
LFLNFGKLSEHAAQNKAGTGLGLSICKQIIDQMGGEVECESELGKGTQFKIKLSCPCLMSQSKYLEKENYIIFEKACSETHLKSNIRIK